MLGLMILLSASVTSLMVKNGLGTCLTYMDNNKGAAAVGQFIATAVCNSSDSKQTNWVRTNSSTSSQSGSLFVTTYYKFCINGTTFCFGLNKGLTASYYQINLKLVDGSSSDTDVSQQWVSLDTNSLPNHYISAVNAQCIHAFSAFRQVI